MSSATLQINVIPKRLLNEAEAAHHCGRPVKRFKMECPCQAVVFPNGDRRYDVQDLDGWIDSLKAGGKIEADDILARLGS
ncbi:hypothetical protein GGQ85_000249 [Nitrobacter vulgaris]|uniref:hypothetical protein n=1 Tax=Nitrobacter vulgaris TaxID=29421 RepID=UPI002865FF00|nr:hypothetical protein [Nitrobacter vulgaris]MDR6302573.1 hypothetical protein [Nitrobacter vulgaris]